MDCKYSKETYQPDILKRKISTFYYFQANQDI